MGRSRSIPPVLYEEVVRRWTLGASPGDLAAWLNGRPASAKGGAVKTTRSSVVRLLQQITATRGEQCRAATVHRARLQSPWAQEEFESVGRELREAIEETKGAGLTRLDIALVSARIQGLAKLSMHLTRQLRAAGTTGAAAQDVTERWSDVTTHYRTEVLAAQAAERATVRNAAASGGKTSGSEADTAAAPAPIPDSAPTYAPAPPPADAPEPLRTAYAAGRTQAPCPLTVARLAVVADCSEALPLTPEELAYATGYAERWAEAAPDRAPTDEAAFFARTIAEVQLQKSLLVRQERLREHLAHIPLEESRSNPAPFAREVALAPETPVPAPFSLTRDLAEAYRAGLTETPPHFHLDPTIRYLVTGDIPLVPTEEAWCEGDTARRRTLPDFCDRPEADVLTSVRMEFQYRKFIAQTRASAAAGLPWAQAGNEGSTGGGSGGRRWEAANDSEPELPPKVELASSEVWTGEGWL
jgi:hypothetical protein